MLMNAKTPEERDMLSNLLSNEGELERVED